MQGLIQIYTGEGKGKTTAAIGLAIRFAGNGGTVLFTQFLKDSSSSELAVLSQLEQVTVFPSSQHFGFSFQMTPEQKKLATNHYTEYLNSIISMSQSGCFGLLILDEILVADHLHLIPHETLVDFLQRKPANLEIVLTGRNPEPDVLALAGYVSDIHCVKHRYQKGIPARKGIEM